MELFYRRLKKKIPPGLLAAAKIIYGRSKLLMLTIISWSGFVSSIYYATLSRAFRREQRAVIVGMLQYLKHKSAESLRFLLRRNIHRIEKGLLMRPRRDLFALDYIVETAHCFKKYCMLPAEKRSTEELRWAQDILTLYFQVCAFHPQIEKAKQIVASVGPISVAADAHVPYQRHRGVKASISYDGLFELARQRRSVRWFLQQPVPRELLDKAVLLAAQAPSACNRQPFSYHFFDAPELLKDLSRLPQGTGGFAHNIPLLCVLVGDLSAYFGERDRHGIYIDASLSAMSFMLALETLGLSSCPLNWPDIEELERKLENAIGLKRYERAVLFIAVGYPDPEGLVAFSQKKGLSELRCFNV